MLGFRFEGGLGFKENGGGREGGFGGAMKGDAEADGVKEVFEVGLAGMVEKLNRQVVLGGGIVATGAGDNDVFAAIAHDRAESKLWFF